jgi:F-type H+-transporting ATPase subunit b
VSLAATVLAAEGEGGGGFWETAYPILPHPGEMIFGFIAIAILYYVVAKYVVPRLEQVFSERAAAIEGGLRKAEAVQAEAVAVRDRYQAELAEALAERTRIIQQASQEAAAVAAEIRQHAQEEANRITAAATQQIQAERQQALVQLRAEVGALATDLASRIVGESLENEARQRRIVDRFLAELEAASAAESLTTGQGF